MNRETLLTAPDGSMLTQGRTRMRFVMQSVTEAQEWMKCFPCPPLAGETIVLEWDKSGMAFTIHSGRPAEKPAAPEKPAPDAGKLAELMAMSDADLLTLAPQRGVMNGAKLLKKGKQYLAEAIAAKSE